MAMFLITVPVNVACSRGMKLGNTAVMSVKTASFAGFTRGDLDCKRLPAHISRLVFIVFSL